MILDKIGEAIKNAPKERKVMVQHRHHNGTSAETTHEIINYVDSPKEQAKAAIAALADSKPDGDLVDEVNRLADIWAVQRTHLGGVKSITTRQMTEALIGIYHRVLKERANAE